MADADSVGASELSAYAVSQEKTNGTRLARLLIDGGTHVLRKVLHSVHPPATLEDVLNNNRRKLEGCVKFDDQREKLFPTSDDPPDSTTFDITLLHLLLREICHLKAPLTGWDKMPADGDVSREANIVRIKCFRNELCHSVSTGIPNGEFEDKWIKISTSLESLEASVYREKLQDLKNDRIDHDTRRAVAEQVEQWRRVEQNDECDAISSLCNFLPDRVPEKLMFGREEEIKKVKEIVHTGTVPVILITGGPGFGKATVAKEVPHELANPDNERTVIFCRLRKKKKVSEVAIEMLDSQCDGIHTHVPKNPAQWLKEWSKPIKSQVCPRQCR